MNTIIQRLDGTVYDLASLGIATRDFVVSSPSPRHFTETVDARHGLIDMGTVYEERTIQGSYFAKAADADDYALMRDEIFRLFRTQEPFYVIESRNPGKRWQVKVSNSFGLDQQRVLGFFDVEFTAHSGFAESIGTTLDAFTFDAELWQVSQGLIADSDLVYEFNTSSFRVFNAGDISVDPRHLPLSLAYIGPSNNLTILNNTTGESWSFTGTSNAGDTIKLEGVRATKNGLSVYRNTNRKLITLAPGWNDFTLTGALDPFSMIFDFRYYYL